MSARPTELVLIPNVRITPRQKQEHSNVIASLNKSIALFVGFSWLCLAPLTVQSATITADQLNVEEVVVTGKRPGPPLWSVSSGDNVLWVFGTLAPVPKKMEWAHESVKRL